MAETIYVVANSDAAAHVARRFPHKTAKHVHNGLGPTSVRSFLRGLRTAFQPQQAAGLDAIYHFTFTGEEERTATVIIRDKTLEVRDGHQGKADLHLIADNRTWIKFLMKEQNLVWAIVRGRIQLKGSPRLLLAFGRCFPA